MYLKSIILFFKKFFAWIISFFLDRKPSTKKKKKIGKNVDVKVVKAKASRDAFFNRDEDMGENHVIDIYPYIEAKELKSIDELIEQLEKEIENINDETKEKELQDLKEIKETIKSAIPLKEKETVDKTVDIKKELHEDKKNQLNVAQQEDIKEILKEAVNDKELHVDTEEKISNIKKEINKIVDNKLNKHEKDIIEKAYYKYEKVNYVVTTTVEIEELEEELKELKDNLKTNKHKKTYYVDKVKEIEKKINRLKKINKNPKVYEELERLKDDFYTKSIDKYDLLYNKEVFINLDRQCEDILDYVESKEQEEKQKDNDRKQQREIEKEEEKRKHQEIERQRELERERERQENEERRTNILKRYLDLKRSNSILIMNSILHNDRLNRDDLIAVLQVDYDDFLMGEANEFNFERNKRKTEVGKLYNNLLEILSREQKIPFVPIEHINYQYEELLEDTISTKDAVERMAFKKTGYDIMMDDRSVMVSDKLDNELQKEKAKNREMGINQKILKKEMKN